jgi:hypothetical protein
MNQYTSSLSIPGDCEIVSMHLTQKLNNAGFQVIRSFDLQRAREVHTSCVCARHGTTECDCQLIVLLVYLPTGEPQTLIVHGQGGTSHLGWGEEIPEQDKNTMLSIFKEVFAQVNNSS